VWDKERKQCPVEENGKGIKFQLIRERKNYGKTDIKTNSELSLCTGDFMRVINNSFEILIF